MRHIANIAKLDHARNFGKVWTFKGLAVPMDDSHYQFATDFANVIMTNFFEQQAELAAKAKAAKEAEQKSILVEG